MQQFMNWHQKQPDQNPNWYKSGENRFFFLLMPLNINNQKADKASEKPKEDTTEETSEQQETKSESGE